MTVPTGGVHRVACTDVTAPGPVDPITEPTDLATAATIAGLSKFHFHRLFSATYGATPAQHLSQRRIERAQDYLRATNLTVTEVCMAVGYSSLGSFSSRFREIVGQTPSAFQAHDARNGAPRVPGCFVHARHHRGSTPGWEVRKRGEAPPYGVEALIRDNSGNWIVMVEPHDFTPEEMADFAGDDPSQLNPMNADG